MNNNKPEECTIDLLAEGRGTTNNSAMEEKIVHVGEIGDSKVVCIMGKEYLLPVCLAYDVNH